MGLVFVGGVHGVGKSTVCNEVATNLDIPIHTASAVIRAGRSGETLDTGKTVLDVDTNQGLLVRGMQERLVKSPGLQLLDGHFALRSLSGSIECVALTVFEQMDVRHIVCFQDDPSNIWSRLQQRDGYSGPLQDIIDLQEHELRHAVYVADGLGLPLQVLAAFDSASLQMYLSRELMKGQICR